MRAKLPRRLPAFAMKGVQSQRAKDLVLLAAEHIAAKTDATGDELEKVLANYVVDFSQSAGRQPWSTMLKPLTTSSQLYASGRKRKLVPLQHMLVLGFGKGISLEHCSNRAVCNLAGEAMALPNVAAILLALCSVIPVWSCR